MPWTQIFSFIDGSLIARAEVNDADADDVRFFLSTDGGATETSFDGPLTDPDPQGDLFSDWLGAVALAYDAVFIDTQRISNAALDADATDNFSFGNTRITVRGNGLWQVRLAGQGVNGALRFRFDTEAEALAFNDFFDAVKTFVEDNDIRNQDAICFAAETRLACENGARRIDNLCVGDRVRTLDGRVEAVRWIGRRSFGKRALIANPNLYPVRIMAGALGPGLPARDLLVSRQHRILISSGTAARMFAGDVLIAAIKLTALPGIYVDTDVDAVTYVHLLFDRHEVLLAEGVPSESLFTGPEAMKMVPAAARAEILAIFPELAHGTATPKPAAIIPAGRDQKRLVAELAKLHGD